MTLGACDGSVRVTRLDLPSRTALPLGVFPCGTQILLRGLDRGAHTLYASPELDVDELRASVTHYERLVRSLLAS